MIIDGKALAQTLRDKVAADVAAMKTAPGLAVVLVGENPASVIYVNNKQKAAEKAGIKTFIHRLPATTSQEDVIALVQKMNADKAVHGILVQLPLPQQIDPLAVLRVVEPKKDVDGLHLENAGRLASGLPGIVPCTPLGCLKLIKSVRPQIAGLHAVVIGRSNLVGKPMAQLLLRENCTVTVCHSKTPDIPALSKQADIIVVAAGRAQLVKADWVKPGAIVIDVGINRVNDKVVGDVDFEAVSKVAAHITPVPGGVGPMTIACLLANTVAAAR